MMNTSVLWQPMLNQNLPFIQSVERPRDGSEVGVEPVITSGWLKTNDNVTIESSYPLPATTCPLSTHSSLPLPRCMNLPLLYWWFKIIFFDKFWINSKYFIAKSFAYSIWLKILGSTLSVFRGTLVCKVCRLMFWIFEMNQFLWYDQLRSEIRADMCWQYPGEMKEM